MHLSQSYKEAQLAMEVGRIFLPDRHVLSYDRLGIGRLIFQLPVNLCKVFLHETFARNIFEELDEETMLTIRHFFENDLNISETARQLFIHRNTLVYRLEKLQKTTGLDIRKFDEAMTFKIAMMVYDYVNHMRTRE
jgi:carbohydrate diacid regulator